MLLRVVLVLPLLEVGKDLRTVTFADVVSFNVGIMQDGQSNILSAFVLVPQRICSKELHCAHVCSGIYGARGSRQTTQITCPSSSSIVQLAVSYLKSYLLESILRKKKLKIPKTWVFHRRYTLYSRRFIGLIHHCSAPSRYVRIVIVCTHCNSIPSAYGSTFGLFCQTSN